MHLFEVPGWSVPDAPVQESKKRKRPVPASDPETCKSVEVNLEKLVARMGQIADGAEGRKKKKAKREEPAQDQKGRGRGPLAKEKGKGQKDSDGGKDASMELSTISSTSPAQNTKSKGKKRKKGNAADSDVVISSASSSKPAETQHGDCTKDLTVLQSGMKSSLDGARFRWINETLYKSDSSHALGMMREDPNIFHEYHKGFRHQVESWPSNPVSHYISVLSSYPAKSVIADLGCGDAELARSLVPKGFTVLSFDLVSDGVFVTEADIFGRLPLPGSEEGQGGGGKHVGQGQVVDVVICALSLMATNWPNCIREAWRILQLGGELKIAEVASRFTDVEAFKSLVISFGFTLKSTDTRNTHLTLFEFKKVARTAKSDKEWKKLLSKSSLLKPCEYKRR